MPDGSNHDDVRRKYAESKSLGEGNPDALTAALYLYILYRPT